MKGLGLRALSKNFGSTLFRQVASGLLSLATTAIIARHYGPEGNGAFYVLLLLPNILGVFLSMGIGPANIYLIGSGKATPRDALRTNYLAASAAGVFGIVFGGLFIFLKGNVAFPGIEMSHLGLALLIFPISLLTSLLAGIYQGLQDFKIFNKILILQPAIFFVFVLSLLLFDNTEMTVLITSYWISCFVVLVWTILHISKEFAKSTERKMTNTQFLKSSMGYGWKVNLASILSFLNYKMDILLVNFFMTTSAAGVYVISVTLAEKLWIVSTALSTVLLPRLSELSNDESKRKQLTPMISRFMLLFMFLVCLPLALIIRPATELIFGDQYLKSIEPLLILLPGILAVAVARVWANDIAARGKVEVNMYIGFLTFVINLVGNIYLIPIYGLHGAAIATTISYTTVSVVTLVLYCRISSNNFLEALIVSKEDINKILLILRR
ncbi:flippase [bacterium]|nr:flippase [bacterium]